MSTERIANGIGPARINLAYERRGDPGDPAVLLIMGLGAQLVHWPTGFLDVLVAHGLHVVRFDNRDSGRSTYMTEAPQPDLAAALAGDLSSVSYTLSDMAADAIGLLDHLGIARARGRRFDGRRGCTSDRDRASGARPLADVDDVHDR